LGRELNIVRGAPFIMHVPAPAEREWAHVVLDTHTISERETHTPKNTSTGTRNTHIHTHTHTHT